MKNQNLRMQKINEKLKKNPNNHAWDFLIPLKKAYYFYWLPFYDDFRNWFIGLGLLSGFAAVALFMIKTAPLVKELWSILGNEKMGYFEALGIIIFFTVVNFLKSCVEWVCDICSSTYVDIKNVCGFLYYVMTEFYNWLAESVVLLNTASNQLLICSLLKIVCILIAVAYFTIAERKVMAAIQRRKGPNVVGFWGLLQPLADGAKLAFKELLIPTRANSTIFLMAPIMVLILSMISWSVIPTGLVVESTQSLADQLAKDLANQLSFGFDHATKSPSWQNSNTVDIDYGVLFLLAVSGLNVYGIIIAGWASNSKYAFLGALRSAAQMISYEVSLGLLILPVILLAGSLNLTEIVAAQERTGWFCFPLLPCAIMFFISMLAETNRAPFDLPEAEAELVAGYNVEYSSIIFAMFFLGEYSNMLLMATVIVLFFFGGWLSPFAFLNFIPGSVFFSLKIVIFCCYLFILVRAAFPRYRYDQLMELGWKTFLPLSLSYLIFVAGFLVAFDAVPQVLEIQPPIYTESYFFC